MLEPLVWPRKAHGMYFFVGCLKMATFGNTYTKVTRANPLESLLLAFPSIPLESLMPFYWEPGHEWCLWQGLSSLKWNLFSTLGQKSLHTEGLKSNLGGGAHQIFNSTLEPESPFSWWLIVWSWINALSPGPPAFNSITTTLFRNEMPQICHLPQCLP